MSKGAEQNKRARQPWGGGGFLLASGLPLSSLKSGGCSGVRIMCYLARDHAWARSDHESHHRPWQSLKNPIAMLLPHHICVSRFKDGDQY